MATRKKAPAKRKAAAKKKAPAKKKAAARGKRGARSRKGNVITVDFEGVDSGGGIPTPDGLYEAEIKSTEEKEGEDSGQPYIEVRWRTSLGSTVYDNFSLQPQALFMLRTMLECLGYDIPDAEYDLDVDALVGEKLIIEVMNEEWDEKPRPRATGYMPLGAVELEDPAEEEEEDDDEYEEEEQEEEEQEEDEQEEEEEEEPPAKSKRKKAPAKKKKAPAKKKRGALRPGAKVEFEDEEGETIEGVLEAIEDGMASVLDTDDGEWEIPLEELRKA